LNNIKETTDGLYLPIKLTPKAKKDSIGKIVNGRLKISVTSPPVDGKANLHLIKVLSKKLKTAKSNIIITTGQASREKVLLITGLTKSNIFEKLDI